MVLKMKGSALLKIGLLKQSSEEQDAVHNLCLIMEVVGGYNQLMELHLSAIEPILKFLKKRNEQENKRFEMKK